MSKSVSVVICAFNEETTIALAAKETVEALSNMNRDFEVIIVNDGSTDKTGELASQAALQLGPRVKTIDHEQNEGLGGIFRTGLDAFKNDVLMFISGDGQPIPELYFNRGLPALESVDMVIGRLPQRDDPFLSLFFSWIEKLVLKSLFPGTPKIEGPFMFRRDIIEGTHLHFQSIREKGWILLIEILVRAVRGGFTYRIVEFGRRPRPVGRSRANTWRYAIKMAILLLKLRYVMFMERS